MEKTHGKPSLNRIYLDFNASTPIAPEVAKEIQSFLVDRFGNPSANHWASHSLQETIHQSRESVALLLGCNPEEIVFTSGASEANNQALKGVFFGRQRRGNHIIATKIEHPSVLEACRFLERVGAQVTYLEVDEFGLVSPEDVEKAITDQTILISIMHANNEVGTIQPILEISRIARKHGIYLHSDAAQSVGRYRLMYMSSGLTCYPSRVISSMHPRGSERYISAAVLFLSRLSMVPGMNRGGGPEPRTFRILPGLAKRQSWPLRIYLPNISKHSVNISGMN
jgi:cysteine sulfinate desulfinase/cysteine desulfurase-like protein